MEKLLLRIAFFGGLIAACAATGRSQANPPEGELFGGAASVWSHGPTTYQTGGAEASFTGNINRFAGVDMDFGEFSLKPQNPPAYANHYLLLFGPHFTYRANPYLNPFAHVLLGLTRGVQAADFTETGRTAFVAGFGGGLDVKVVRFLWVRLIQVDYLHESFPNDGQNNLRLSVGLVLRFGSVGRR